LLFFFAVLLPFVVNKDYHNLFISSAVSYILIKRRRLHKSSKFIVIWVRCHGV